MYTVHFTLYTVQYISDHVLYHGIEGPEDSGASDGEADLGAEASQDL